jgi:DNA-binding PadR family transcriptional regulator
VADTTVREPTYLILLALAGGRLHGYGVIRTVLELSGGRVTLRPGTVYGALERLEAQGLIGAGGEEIEQGRVRRYYEITEAGSAVLVAETERMASNVTAARRQLGRRNHSLGVEGA